MAIFPRLRLPGSNKPALHYPDLRNVADISLDGRAVPGERDFDDLQINRSWREYELDSSGHVRYFMYSVSQRNPGSNVFVPFYKAVRMIRLTRVPRYLRQATLNGNGTGAVFEQQRDVLTALREQNVMFINMIAKSPNLPLVFGYGVQATGETALEAQVAADEAYAVLKGQLDGTYQQLMYQPLTVAEGETIARNQAEWGNIAIARGRPVPTGGSMGNAGLLDGNRTDVENANNQLESFIRGMSDKSFMLTLITVPLKPADITLAWRNLTQKLSDVRSDQSGTRSVHAGVALPLTMGAVVGDSHTAGQGVTSTEGTGTSQSEALGTSTSQTQGTSVADMEGLSQSNSVTDSTSRTEGTNMSVADGISAGASQNVGASTTQGVNASTGTNESASMTDTVGTSQTDTLGTSQTDTVGTSQTDTVGTSRTDTAGVSNTVTDTASQSVTQGSAQTQTVGSSNTSTVGTTQSTANTVGSTSSVGTTTGTSQTDTSGWNTSQSTGTTNTVGSGTSTGWNQGSGSSAGYTEGLNAGVPGFTGSAQDTLGANMSNGISGSASTATSQANSVSESSGLSGSTAFGSSQSQSQGFSNSQSSTQGFATSQSQSQSVSQSLANTVSQATTVGSSQSVAQGTSQSTALGASQSTALGTSQSTALGTSQSTALGASQSTALGSTTGVTASQGTSATTGQTAGSALSTGTSTTSTAGVSTADTTSRALGSTQGTSQSTTNTASQTTGTGTSQVDTSGASTSKSLADAYQVALARSAGQTSSLAVAPTFGVSLSKQTYDEGKRVIGDLLEAQQRRYMEGIESGAFLYQMFLTTPDRETLVAGSGLLKAAFWGAGGIDKRLPQPFHTMDTFGADEEEHRQEAHRLLAHASAFSSYRRREPQSGLVEPFLYSTYVTPGEAATFCHPPTAESTGLLAVQDSMPVLAMPADRQDKPLYLGRVFNGERAVCSNVRYGFDPKEMVHLLLTGITGSGKTTSLMRLLLGLTEASSPYAAAVGDGVFARHTTRTSKASILALDWMSNMRDLAGVVPQERFRFYHLLKPHLGEFRWNVLAVPAEGMSTQEWLNQQADNFTASFALGDFGRSLIAELLTDLYSANRLVDTELLPAVVDDDGQVVRPAVILPAIDQSDLDMSKARVNAVGEPVLSAMEDPALSRCVGIEHLATLVAAKSEAHGTTEAGRAAGTAIRDRLQSLWRRISYFAPGGQYANMLSFDPSPTRRECLTVTDLVDPDEGLVTVVETDGLDLPSRRLILGSVLMAVYRFGLFNGEGTFDHNGQGPGVWVVLEEAHELFGEAARDEDPASVATRNALYESLFRRCRALGMHLITVAQNPSSLPEAVTSNISTIVVHQLKAQRDRERAAAMLNWANTPIGGNLREIRWLGELPTGHCVVQVPPKDSWLETSPTNIVADPAGLRRITDDFLAQRATRMASTADVPLLGAPVPA